MAARLAVAALAGPPVIAPGSPKLASSSLRPPVPDASAAAVSGKAVNATSRRRRRIADTGTLPGQAAEGRYQRAVAE